MVRYALIAIVFSASFLSLSNVHAEARTLVASGFDQVVFTDVSSGNPWDARIRGYELNGMALINGGGAGGIAYVPNHPVAADQSEGVYAARVVGDGPLGEIESSAAGDDHPSNWASGKIFQEATIVLEAHTRVLVTGDYFYDIGAPAGFELAPGLARLSASFQSDVAPESNVSFSEGLFVETGDAGGSLAGTFSLLLVNDRDIPIEGVLNFTSLSYVSITAVPEPATYLMLVIGLLALTIRGSAFGQSPVSFKLG